MCNLNNQLASLQGQSIYNQQSWGGHPGLGFPPGLSLLGEQQRQAYQYDAQRNVLPRPNPNGCRIGKVTPKPGYVRDGDEIRPQRMSDFKWWQRVLIWIQE